MDRQARAFARLDDFLDGFNPLTPYGRARKAGCAFHACRAELEQEFDLTEAFARFIGSASRGAEKLAWHLKRIPRLELPFPARPDRAELFELKKFLYNARAAFGLLGENLRAALGIEFDCAELLALLTKDGEPESFYLAAEPGSELARVRAEIAAADRALAAVKTARLRELLERCGLDFSDKAFIVLDAARAAALPDGEIYAEPHDARRVIARPVYGREYAALAAAREKLDSDEKTASARELAKLSEAARAAESAIAAIRERIERVDTLLAKARFAVERRLVRPVFSEGAVSLEAGVFVPLKARLEAEGLKYTPLSCSFVRPVGLVYGSNMGGKTVALQTVAFMQLLAQGGYFVPAKRFETRVFETVRFVGANAEPGSGADDGLSGFGREVSAFNGAYPHAGKKSFFIMDEFARTTNSAEARALLSAVVETLGSRNGLTLIATHFAGVVRTRHTGVYRMRGFDGRAFSLRGGAAGAGQEERLRAINRFMRYELVEDGGASPAQDALSVARALGLDSGIIELAQKNMEDR
ncbi:MAG: hypothetical protein PHW69_09130 [Elusimicrobiaceae bacterium]|nr:hypothetical protein [Elusimicrobiaceae bacterium]